MTIVNKRDVVKEVKAILGLHPRTELKRENLFQARCIIGKENYTDGMTTILENLVIQLESEIQIEDKVE